MSQHRQKKFVAIRTVFALLLWASLSSIVFTCLLARPTYALVSELLDTTTKTLDTLTDNQAKPVTKALTQAVTPQKDASAAGTSSSSAPENTSTLAKSEANMGQSTSQDSSANKLSYSASLLKLFAKLDLNISQYALHFSPASRASPQTTKWQQTYIALDNSDFSEPFALIESSPQGWKLFGVLWYWWALAGAAASSAAIYNRFGLKYFPYLRFNS